MPGKRLMWTGLIGFVVGLIALLICLLLPVVAGPNVSWGEAMLGIIPSGVLTLVFLVLMLIGMATLMSNQQDRPRRRSHREEYDDDEYEDNDDDDEDDRRPRRRRSR
ncbi:MAG: hypothetical protein L0Y71_22195 [Gemmataceae bacterium]|nr:hypothetical protein [Gemmataceae bacterium]